MAIFNSYVSLPEGIASYSWLPAWCAFRNSRPGEVMISCSKPNLGHLEGGAGMSAFCKPLGLSQVTLWKNTWKKTAKKKPLCTSDICDFVPSKFACLFAPFSQSDSQGFFLVRYGLPRCILACMHAEAASNQHLRVQNPNLDIEGGLWAPHPSALGGSQVSDRKDISLIVPSCGKDGWVFS